MPAPVHEPTVYFYLDLVAQLLKIGRTRNLDRRSKSYRTHNGTDLVLLGTLPGGKAEETAVHQMLAASRKRGEWFHATPETLQAVRLLLARSGSPRTVEDELQRRQGCRYGLHGVQVGLRDREPSSWAILRSHWDAQTRLRVDVCLSDEFPPCPWPDGGIPGRTQTISAAALALAWRPDPDSTIRDVLASDCFLLSDWPIVCRCWCDD